MIPAVTVDETFFDESVYDAIVGSARVNLRTAIAEYEEAWSFSDHILKEGAFSSLLDKIQKFFIKLNYSINRFMDEFATKLESTILEKDLKKKLKAYREAVTKGESKPLVIPDYRSMKGVLLSGSKEMMAMLKTLSTKRYKTEDDIRTDFESCERKFEEVEARLSTIQQSPVLYERLAALNFVSQELSNPQGVIKTYCGALGNFKDVANQCTAMYRQRMTYGNDLLPSRFAFIEKIANKITGWVRRHTISMLMKLVLLFA